MQQKRPPSAAPLLVKMGCVTIGTNPLLEECRLLRWQMYMQIHSMKNQGFSKRQVAEKMELNFRTVSKYLSLTTEEF